VHQLELHALKSCPLEKKGGLFVPFTENVLGEPRSTGQRGRFASQIEPPREQGFS
jgi:hypothetical protein